jgi:hypothetical protein
MDALNDLINQNLQGLDGGSSLGDEEDEEEVLGDEEDDDLNEDMSERRQLWNAQQELFMQ